MVTVGPLWERGALVVRSNPFSICIAWLTSPYVVQPKLYIRVCKDVQLLRGKLEIKQQVIISCYCTEEPAASIVARERGDAPRIASALAILVADATTESSDGPKMDAIYSIDSIAASGLRLLAKPSGDADPAEAAT